jgi:hypothetical protein
MVLLIPVTNNRRPSDPLLPEQQGGRSRTRDGLESLRLDLARQCDEIDSSQSTHDAESSSIDDEAPQTQPPKILGLNSMPQPSTPKDDYKPLTDRSYPSGPDKASHDI